MKKAVVTISQDFNFQYQIDGYINTRFIFEPGHTGSGGAMPLVLVTAESHGIEVMVQNVLTTTNSYAIESEADKTLIQIDESGVINGYQAIHLLGDSQTVINDGKIEVSYVGIRMEGSGSNITNNGTITGQYAFAVAADSRRTTITNNGEIHVTNIAAFIEGRDITINLGQNSNVITDNNGLAFALNSANSNSVDHITNAGNISSATVLEAGAGQQIVKNTGTMNGDVRLNGGNDIFDTAMGVYTGVVSGGTGDDVYIFGSTLVDIFEGGAGGIDTVRLSASISLQSAPYVGDEIENITLLGKGDLTATGNTLDNLIIGNSGNNILDGYSGYDRIIGGKGRDDLAGGIGTVFVFNTGDSGKTSASADTIYGFHDGTIDLTGWDANSKKHGMQHFQFIDDHAFSGHAGQLHVVNGGTVEGDTNGDRKADFQINVNDVLDAFDFAL